MTDPSQGIMQDWRQLLVEVGMQQGFKSYLLAQLGRLQHLIPPPPPQKKKVLCDSTFYKLWEGCDEDMCGSANFIVIAAVLTLSQPGGGGGFNIRTRIGSSFVWNRACAVRTLWNKMATTVTRPCKNTRSRIFSFHRDRAERPRTAGHHLRSSSRSSASIPSQSKNGAKTERKRSTRCMVSSSTALGVDRLWLWLSPVFF